MKFFLVLFALAAIAVSSIEAQNKQRCSLRDYKPVPFMRFLGRWIVYKTYANGPEKNWKCSFYEMAQNEQRNIVWRSEISEDNSKSCTKGYFTYTDLKFSKIFVDWFDFVKMPLNIVSTDYESYFIARTCLDNEGEFGFWFLVYFI